MNALPRAYLATAIAMYVIGVPALMVFGFDARFSISTPLIVAVSILGLCVAGKRAVQDMQEGRKQWKQ